MILDALGLVTWRDFDQMRQVADRAIVLAGANADKLAEVTTLLADMTTALREARDENDVLRAEVEALRR